MSFRRLTIAAAALLVATYLKFFLPSFSTEVTPALHELLDKNQIVLRVPEDWLPWLDWS